MMHMKYLGTDLVLLGGCISWAVRHVLPGNIQENLNYLMEWLRSWHQKHGKKGSRLISKLTERMLSGEPVPRLHAKAGEVKTMLPAVSAFFQNLVSDNHGNEDLKLMSEVLSLSARIDINLDQQIGFMVNQEIAEEFKELIHSHNKKTAILCHRFHSRALAFFNFIPKHHYLFHIADLSLHLSPKLGWCWKGEDMMYKVKMMAQASCRAIAPTKLGNKVVEKYLISLDLALGKA